MTRTFRILCLSAAAIAITSGTAFAGGMASEPILEKAIKETAAAPAPVVEEAPAPAPEPTPAPVIAAKPKSFVFEPSLKIGEKYESNLFATDTDERSDFITMITPALHMGLVNSKHKLDAEGEFEVNRNLHHKEDSQNNYKAKISGLLEAAKSLHFPFELGFKRVHEERIDDLIHQDSHKPIHFTDFKGGAGLEFKPGALGFALKGMYQELRYSDGETETGVPVVRRDADQDNLDGEAAISYDFSGANTLSLIGRAGHHDYKRRNFQAGDFAGPSRDNDRWAVLAGLKSAFKGMMADLKLGVGDVNYEDNGVQDVRTMIGESNLHFDLSDATGLTLAASRFVHEDDEVLDPIVRTDVGLTLDHDISDRLNVAAGAERQNWNFENSDRDDKVWKLKALAEYAMTQHFSLGAEYNYITRSSDAAGLDMKDHVAMVNLKGKL